MPEIILGLVGVYVLIAGRIPAWLTGSQNAAVVGGRACAIGLIFIAPIPTAIGLGMITNILFGDRLTRYYTLIELGLVGLALALGLLLIRKFSPRRRSQP